MHTFNIPINPVAKGRPRFTKAGFTYTPKRTRDFEMIIAHYYKQEFKGAPLTGPVGVTIDFFIPKPKTSKNQFPIVRPDLDNLCKSVTDPMNKILIEDDCQIVNLRLSKIYADKPRIEVRIWEIGEFFV